MAATENAAYAADEDRWSTLMRSAQAGHEADYRRLLSELSEVIARYLRSRLGPQHFIDDCVQETLIAVHQARHTFDPKRKFRPWLFAIVRHKAIDALRRQRAIQDKLGQQASMEDASTDNQQLENDIMSGRLIDSLPSPHREAITLTKLVGLSTAEAASHLAISESALKVRVHRALGNLKRMMEADAL